MSRFARRQLVAAGAAVGLLLSIPSFAAADEILLTLPVSGVHRGAEGTSVQVASANVPAELVGQSCEIFGSTVNQRSVHPGNDLVIVNGDESFTIPNFEDEGDIVHDAGDVETLAASIQVSIRFGPDGVSSGGFRVTLRNCTDVAVEEVAPPVETTVPAVATTAPETTESTVAATTVPSTIEVSATEVSPTEVSPTEVSPTEVTAAPVDPAGPTEESTTTADPTTPSEAPTTAPSTTAPSTSAAPNPLGPTAVTDTLPVTGSSTWLLAGFGAFVAAAGAAMRFYAGRVSSL